MAKFKVIIQRKHDEDENTIEADRMTITDNQRLEFYAVDNMLMAVYLPGRWLNVIRVVDWVDITSNKS